MTTLSLSDLAVLCDARLEGDGARLVKGPASLEDAEEDEVSFLVDPRYLPQLQLTRAAAAVVGEGVESRRADLALLRCADPQRAFNRVVEAFRRERPAPSIGIHPSAVLDESAEVALDACIGPLCVIGAGAVVGSGVVLHARVTVGAHVRLGDGCELHPGVVLYPHVTIGERCLVHAGAVIGSDGFGFEPCGRGWRKTPQGGTVVIEDDVEIGANVTIDCARFKATTIASGVKIDNLVHIGHNCRIGRFSLFLAQSAVAGSTVVGERAIIAGQAGIGGHLEIGDGARVGAASAVFRDVPSGEDYWGNPAGPKTEVIKRVKRAERLGELQDRVRALERRLAELEGGG